MLIVPSLPRSTWIMSDYLGQRESGLVLKKAHIYRAGRPAICSDPQPPESLPRVAAALGADLWLFGRDFHYQSLPTERGPQQWRYVVAREARRCCRFPLCAGEPVLKRGGRRWLRSRRSRAIAVSQQAVREG